MDEQENASTSYGLKVAIVGLAGRFPGALDVAAFWENLRRGEESISFFSTEEVPLDPSLPLDAPYVRANGVLDGVDLFDADLFGYSPREAEMIDPQQRVFLECAWQALEDAGFDPARHTGPIGVYGGVGANSYLFNILAHPSAIRQFGVHQIAIANDKDYLASRVSYKLNLEGPSVVVQTACSSSLVAVHLACQGLLSGECDLALAGGASISLPQKTGYLYKKGGVLSADGHCRPFDARASGTVSGQGAGIVVLKRLADAMADGDTVRAVILGSAVNNDGSEKAGFTAPRVDGQAKVILSAQLLSGVSPETVGYVEAHGTGTEMGDPIEVAALTRAFREGTDKRGFCAIGSVKGNIGHLDAAAGIASLIKTVLVLEHGMVPASLHFERPNPEIDFESSPFYVNDRLREWPAGTAPRRAGVSSFGLGGTNAHVILEEAPVAAVVTPSRPWQLLGLSALSEPALEAATANLATHLAAHPEQDLADVAYTLRVGRKQLEHRRVLVCRDRDDAVAALEAREPGRLLTAIASRREPAVVFLFPGLGDHYAGMGRGLYEAEPRFREEMDRCADLLVPELGLDLRDVLYPGWRVPSGREESSGGIDDRLDLRRMVRPRPAADAEATGLAETWLAQPALFAVEYALARLWMSWGVEPQAMLGHSLGEYVASCLAGVMPLADGVRLVALRARLIESLPVGAMLAVPLPEARIRTRLGEHLSLSAVNAPEQCVVAGPVEEVAMLEGWLAAEGTVCRRLQTAHAFHSRQMEPIVPRFLDLLRSVKLQKPRTRYISNVTGTWIDASMVTDPQYWVRHLCEPVRFAEGLDTVCNLREATLLEVGPGQMLSSLAAQRSSRSGGKSSLASIPSLRHEHDPRADQAVLLKALGHLWIGGVEVDWTAFQGGETRRRVPLPTYPFDRRRFWIERPAATAPAEKQENARVEKLPDPSQWFFVPSWKRLLELPMPPSGEQGESWLLFLDSYGVGARLAERLKSLGHEVSTVTPGPHFSASGGRRYVLDPGCDDGYGSLLAALGRPPERVVHLWNLSGTQGDLDRARFAEAQDLGFYSLIALAQAWNQRFASRPVELTVVANGLATIERGDRSCPEKATLLGPLRVIPQEHPGMSCRAIDLDLEEVENGPIDPLLGELCGADRPPLVARRGSYRWVPLFEPLPLAAAAPPPRLRSRGVYLITGGLGGIGLELAAFLVRAVGARLVLTGRSDLPERGEWPRLSGAADETGRKLRGLEALEASGAEMLVMAADVTDPDRMRQVVTAARERFGRIDGVFHAAGLPGSGLIQVKSREAAARVMAPKTLGTLVLEEALGDQELDFSVLFSSVAALAGEIGQVDYCAANCFLDAFAQHHRLASGRATFSVGWCQWQWDGWTEASSRLDPALQLHLTQGRRQLGLTFEEGMEALCRILASDLPQVAVSTRGAPSASHQPFSIARVLQALSEARRIEGGRHPRPALANAYLAPADGKERQLADIWEELLGIEGIGAADNFFDLGGDSLIGVQLLSRVAESFRLDLTLHTLFAGPSIREMATAIELQERDRGLVSPERMTVTRRQDALEPDVDGLSDLEVDEMLSRMLAESPEVGQ